MSPRMPTSWNSCLAPSQVQVIGSAFVREAAAVVDWVLCLSRCVCCQNKFVRSGNKTSISEKVDAFITRMNILGTQTNYPLVAQGFATTSALPLLQASSFIQFSTVCTTASLQVFPPPPTPKLNPSTNQARSNSKLAPPFLRAIPTSLAPHIPPPPPHLVGVQQQCVGGVWVDVVGVAHLAGGRAAEGVMQEVQVATAKSILTAQLSPTSQQAQNSWALQPCSIEATTITTAHTRIRTPTSSSSSMRSGSSSSSKHCTLNSSSSKQSSRRCSGWCLQHVKQTSCCTAYDKRWRSVCGYSCKNRIQGGWLCTCTLGMSNQQVRHTPTAGVCGSCNPLHMKLRGDACTQTRSFLCVARTHTCWHTRLHTHLHSHTYIHSHTHTHTHNRWRCTRSISACAHRGGTAPSCLPSGRPVPRTLPTL